MGINNIINNLNLNQLILFVPNTERVSRFAAHMACYIWFSDYQQQPPNNANNNSNSIIDVQSSSNWSLSLEIPPGGSYVNCQRYNEYKPKDPFKKFCLDVLTTTQISFPAILLSLLYIHRMKIRNPKIKGQNGSEYRTFTVALMLANKFLDDNTYTNKTWSEVTRIPVAEINTMEIEFLSALQYKLFVSLDHYNDWLQKITRFINYGDDDSNNNNNNNNNNQDNISVVNNNNNSNNNNNNINNNCGGNSCGNCKRSAQEAFVDDMTISPPKRTNITATTTTTTNHNNNSLQYLLPISLSSSSSSSNYNNNNNNNNSNSRSSSSNNNNNNNYNYNNYNYNYARTSSINGMATSAYSYNNPSQPAIEIGSTSYNIPLSNNNYFGNLLLPLTTATVV